MKAAIESVKSSVDEWVMANAIPENDWARMRSLEFQELLRTRDALVRQLDSKVCTKCSNFDDHVRRSHASSSNKC
jgi:antiviral helicase SKI2